jgi:hypothetical protein
MACGDGREDPAATFALAAKDRIDTASLIVQRILSSEASRAYEPTIRASEAAVSLDE